MRSLGPGIARGVDCHLVWRSVGRLPLANAPASGTLPAPCLRHTAAPFVPMSLAILLPARD